jgi:phosphatidylglycerol:prolipoprotein diacylglycerol transferase
MLAFTLATWQARRAAHALPDPKLISPSQATDLACVALLGGIVGARVFFALLHWEFFVQAPLAFFALWQGGLVWYGGFAGGLLATWWYARRHRLPLLPLADLYAPALALGHAIGRVGCFLNGCCFGRPTEAWCGIAVPGVPGRVLPVQLMEALGLFFLYLALRSLQQPARLGSRPGGLFGLYLCAYGVLRFALEYVRGDQVSAVAGLTLQQLLSLLIILAGALLLPRRSHLRNASQAMPMLDDK